MVINSVENVSAVMQEVTAGANETLEGSRRNLESVADIADIMGRMNESAEKLRAAHS